MTSGQMKLAESLLDRKLKSAGKAVFLTTDEVKNIYGDIEESAISLQELGIFLPTASEGYYEHL